MTYIHRTLTILIATFILLIGVAVINQPVHAEADQFRYIQVGLNEEEIELLFESSIVYQDITYYGVRQSADVWRFLINEDVVEDTLIDQITLYDASGVPYSFYDISITESFPVHAEEVNGSDAEAEADVETEPVVQEAPADLSPPVVALEVGKEAAIDRAVVGGVIPYTFYIENTGNTTLFVKSLEDSFFSGGLSEQAIRTFNERLETSLMNLIGDDGLLPQQRVEVTHDLIIPRDYPQSLHPEIGNVFRVQATGGDEHIQAESQQIVLLQNADFKVRSIGEPSQVHPGERVVYTYTLTNTSGVTLHFVDVKLNWVSGALTSEEQRLSSERFAEAFRSQPVFEGGFGPGEEVVFSFEQPLSPSYDVRSGAKLVNQATFTLGVKGAVNVTRQIETPVAVKQAFPELETKDPVDQVENQSYQVNQTDEKSPEERMERETTDVSKSQVEIHPPKQQLSLAGMKPVMKQMEPEDIATIETVKLNQDVLPMTSESDQIWRFLAGVLLLGVGSLLVIRNGRRTHSR